MLTVFWNFQKLMLTIFILKALKISVLVISETRLDGSFATGQFKIPGYASPVRLNWNQTGGEIFVRDGFCNRGYCS